MPDGREEFRQEEVERDTQEETDNAHEMLCDHEDQKDYRRRELQGLPDDPWVEEISLKGMDDEQHSENRDDDAPAWVFHDSGEEDRDAADKDSEDRHETGEERDTSECQKVGEDVAPMETQLPIEQPDDDEADDRQDRVCDRDFPLSLKYEPKAFLDLFEDDAHVAIKEGEGAFFELGEIPFDRIIFQEPDETQDIGEKYLEEYAADAQKFTEDGTRIRARRNDAHEITDLVGEILPLTQRILDP